MTPSTRALPRMESFPTSPHSPGSDKNCDLYAWPWQTHTRSHAFLFFPSRIFGSKANFVLWTRWKTNQDSEGRMPAQRESNEFKSFSSLLPIPLDLTYNFCFGGIFENIHSHALPIPAGMVIILVSTSATTLVSMTFPQKYSQKIIVPGFELGSPGR